MCSIKMVRSGFSSTPQQWMVVLFTHFFFRYDFKRYSETFLIDYFFLSIIISKVCISNGFCAPFLPSVDELANEIYKNWTSFFLAALVIGWVDKDPESNVKQWRELKLIHKKIVRFKIKLCGLVRGFVPYVYLYFGVLIQQRSLRCLLADDFKLT